MSKLNNAALWCTFVSHKVDVNRSDEPSSQRLPSSYHHVDQPSAVKHSLHHLLPVLIGQVDVVDLQQPIIHPGNTKRVDDEALDKTVGPEKRGTGQLLAAYLNLPSAILPLSTLVTNIPQSPGKYGSFTPSAISNPSAFKSMSSCKKPTV